MKNHRILNSSGKKQVIDTNKEMMEILQLPDKDPKALKKKILERAIQTLSNLKEKESAKKYKTKRRTKWKFWN